MGQIYPVSARIGSKWFSTRSRTQSFSHQVITGKELIPEEA